MPCDARVRAVETSKTSEEGRSRIWLPTCEQILELEGLWVKLGQFMSTRADVVPDAWVQELKKLQDAMPARPFADTRYTIEDELNG